MAKNRSSWIPDTPDSCFQGYIPSVFWILCPTKRRYKIIGPCIRYLRFLVVILLPIFSVFEVRVWLKTGVPGFPQPPDSGFQGYIPSVFSIFALRKGDTG